MQLSRHHRHWKDDYKNSCVRMAVMTSPFVLSELEDASTQTRLLRMLPRDDKLDTELPTHDIADVTGQYVAISYI